MLAVTPGEPAGIGPDLILTVAQEQRAQDLVVVGSAALLEARARLLGLDITLHHDSTNPSRAPGTLTVSDVPLAGRLSPGEPDVANVPGVLACLDAAIEGCLAGDFSGLVTGPMQKSIVNDAGIAFSGHTEYLAEKAAVEDVVMLLVAGEFRVALATTHLPLAAVPTAITQALLTRRLKILHAGLCGPFAIENPEIYVAGLNPHAGEGGHLGREEIEIITPVCQALRSQGLKIHGPLPADTLFTPDYVARADGFMAMYHDQGLPVLKYAGFGQAVNVTLGLPFVRVSVDHGTALDIAGTGRAETGSFEQACALAAQLSARQTASLVNA